MKQESVGWGKTARDIVRHGIGHRTHNFSCNIYSDISGGDSSVFEVHAFWQIDGSKLKDWERRNPAAAETLLSAKSWKDLRTADHLVEARRLLVAAREIGGAHAVFCYQSKLRNLSWSPEGIAKKHAAGVLLNDWSGHQDRDRLARACRSLSLLLAETTDNACQANWVLDNDAIASTYERWRDVVSIATSFCRHEGVALFPVRVTATKDASQLDRALCNVSDYIAGMWLASLQAKPAAVTWLSQFNTGLPRTPTVTVRPERFDMISNWFHDLNGEGERVVVDFPGKSGGLF